VVRLLGHEELRAHAISTSGAGEHFSVLLERALLGGLRWDLSRGSDVSLSRVSPPPGAGDGDGLAARCAMWETVPGVAFLSAASAASGADKCRGSFALRDGRARLVPDRQHVDKAFVRGTSTRPRRLWVSRQRTTSRPAADSATSKHGGGATRWFATEKTKGGAGTRAGKRRACKKINERGEIDNNKACFVT
jgi:hypothetical protein